MKTKKEILLWWEKQWTRNPNTDLKDIQKKLDKELSIHLENKNTKMTIMDKKRWKWSIKLYFTRKGECYRIVGF